VRNALVAALVACAERPLKLKARRFLLGLSSDELQFIAEYFGACILASGEDGACDASGLAGRIVRLQRHAAESMAADRDLKLILLREYLCRAGVQEVPVPISYAVQ
jgi:hypothetical protein